MKHRIVFGLFTCIFIIAFFQRLYPQNRIVTDNPFYTSFDKIHYTVFLNQSPEDYYAAELIDAYGKIWKQQKLKTDHNRLNGAISLDYRLPTGFYWIRIYPAAFYDKPDVILYKPLVVINAEDLDKDIWKKTLQKIDGNLTVYFFSQNMQNGPDIQEINIGVIDESGKIITGRASVTDHSNHNQYNLSSTDQGLFTCTFTPEKGHTYSMTIWRSESDSLTFTFNRAGIRYNDLKYFYAAQVDATAGNIHITPDRNFYLPEDSVHFTLSGEGLRSMDPGSELLVSVAESGQHEVVFDQKPVALIVPDHGMAVIPITDSTDSDKCFCLRGKYINPSTGVPRANYSIALIGLGENPGIKFTHADKNGNFTFDASTWPENNSVYISTIGQPAEGLTYSDHFFRKFSEQPVVDFGREDFAPLDSFITEAKIRSVLHFQYGNRGGGTPRNAEQILYDTTRIYSKPDVSYDLNDYIQFNDVADIIHNILIYVHLNSTKQGDRLFIFNNQNRSLNKNPLYLINGIPTRDLHLVLGLNVKDIQKIDLLYTVEAIRPFGIAGLGGIMAIYTTQNVEVPNTIKVNLQGLHRPAEYSVPVIKKGIPDFSPVVFWDPHYRPDEGKPVPGIRLNNLISNLKIYVIGKKADGELISGSADISIKPEQ